MNYSKLEWIPISSTIKSTHVLKVQQTHLQMHDNPWHSFLTGSDEEIIYNTSVFGTRPYEQTEHVHVRISIERDLNEIQIEREVYGLLHLLGDVGGLGEAVFILFSLAVSMKSYKGFENFMVQHLYKSEKEREKSRERGKK